jgi:hypothetical protein
MELKPKPSSLMRFNRKIRNGDIIMITAAFFFIAAGYSTAMLTEEKIMKLTSEDGLFENIGAGFFLITSIMFFSGFIKSTAGSFFLFRRFSRNYTFLLLALMFFIIFGEEISWGQRILSYNPGNFFMSNNMQMETNIHNLKIFHALDENQTRKEWWEYFSLSRLFRLFWFIWCITLPVLEKITPRITSIRQSAGIPAVPVSFGLLFLINYSVLKILENNMSRMTEVVEIEECITAVLFFLLAYRLVSVNRYDHLPDVAKEHLSILPENSYR